MNNGRLSNGFILGLIIGGGAVFLFGTKTGKKILKKFSEEGLEGLTEMLSDIDLEEYVGEEDFEEDNVSEIGKVEEELREETTSEERPTSKKRFFRKSAK